MQYKYFFILKDRYCLLILLWILTIWWELAKYESLVLCVKMSILLLIKLQPTIISNPEIKGNENDKCVSLWWNQIG